MKKKSSFATRLTKYTAHYKWTNFGMSIFMHYWR